MTKELIINVAPQGVEIALLEDKKLVELHNEKADANFAVGDLYLGKVKKLIPGLNAAFVDGLDAAMIFNWDATQFVIDPEGYAKVVKCKGDYSQPATSLSAGGLGFAVKYYHFHNANGDMGPAVFIIADDTMGPDDFFVEEVIGLSHTQLMTATGYLVFTKTRNCNKAFYEWYALQIVTPFVTTCRETHDCKNPDGTPMSAFVICDGEPSQITVFQQAFILLAFAVALIIFAKSPASCSATTQSSDDSHMFNGTKKTNERIREKDYINVGLQTRLKKILLERITMDGEHRFTSAKRSLICDALMQIVYSMQHVLTPEVIKGGYRRIGQYPVSLATAMGRCSRQITARDMDNIREKMPGLVTIFRSTGRLTEEEMDAAGIISVNHEASNSRPKDDRPLHQQRAVIMNSEHCISQYNNYQAIRAAEPARKQQREELREAAKVIRDEKAAEMRLKKVEKDAEKLRKSLLTPAELKEEAKIKRVANKAAKQALREGANQQQPVALEVSEDVDSDDEEDNLFDDNEMADISSQGRSSPV